MSLEKKEVDIKQVNTSCLTFVILSYFLEFHFIINEEIVKLPLPKKGKVAGAILGENIVISLLYIISTQRYLG